MSRVESRFSGEAEASRVAYLYSAGFRLVVDVVRWIFLEACLAVLGK